MTTISYDTGEFAGDVGRPVRRSPTRAATRSRCWATTSTHVAAIGRDPERASPSCGAARSSSASPACLLGMLLLVLAGRRSKRASTPGRRRTGRAGGTRPEWRAGVRGRPSHRECPRCRSTRINPTRRPRSTPPPPPLPARAPGAGVPRRPGARRWGPPAGVVRGAETAAAVPTPQPIPVLPDAPGAVSGTWPPSPVPPPPDAPPTRESPRQPPPPPRASPPPPPPPPRR